jgi:bifunctional non-homologous end joining protein LigD
LIFDGKATVFDADLVSRIELLQDRGGPRMYMVFDCCYQDGHDYRSELLTARRERLKMTVDGIPRLFPARQLAENGTVAFRNFVARGCEGVIAKNPLARYLAGCSPQWVKMKRRQEGEFVVGGIHARSEPRLFPLDRRLSRGVSSASATQSWACAACISPSSAKCRP